MGAVQLIHNRDATKTQISDYHIHNYNTSKGLTIAS